VVSRKDAYGRILCSLDGHVLLYVYVIEIPQDAAECFLCSITYVRIEALERNVISTGCIDIGCIRDIF
jgi:hypothetical protein